MVPHPITCHNAREDERRALLAAVQRHGRETRELAARTSRPPAVRPATPGRPARPRRTAPSHAMPGIWLRKRLGPRPLARFFAMFT